MEDYGEKSVWERVKIGATAPIFLTLEIKLRTGPDLYRFAGQKKNQISSKVPVLTQKERAIIQLNLYINPKIEFVIIFETSLAKNREKTEENEAWKYL